MLAGVLWGGRYWAYQRMVKIVCKWDHGRAVDTAFQWVYQGSQVPLLISLIEERRWLAEER